MPLLVLSLNLLPLYSIKPLNKLILTLLSESYATIISEVKYQRNNRRHLNKTRENTGFLDH